MKKAPTKAEYLGLNPPEAAIWRSLVNQKQSQRVTDIAQQSEQTRPTVYKYLRKFERLGLVSRTNAVGQPQYRVRRMKSVNPFASKPSDRSDDQVQVLKGHDLKKVWQMVLAELPKKGVFYRYDGYSSTTSIAKYIPAEFYRQMEQKKLERFVITNQRLRKGVYKKRLECASRMLPASFDAFEQGVTEFIFGDTIAMIDVSTETAFLIKNAALAEYHRKRFQYLYAHLSE